jgi:DNA ligase (NAD+)
MNSLIAKLEHMNMSKLKGALTKMPITTLRELQSDLDAKYEKGDTGLADFRYDMVEEYRKQRDPDFKPEDAYAESSGDEEKVALPYFLGSMEKVKPTDEKKLTGWLGKNASEDYIVSSKLDGISCLAVYQDGEHVRLYTRGRKGTVGHDISWLAPRMSTIPVSLNDDIAVRGEIVMPLNTFTRKYKGDALAGYNDARSIVQGLVKGRRPGVSDLHFVTYEVLSDEVVPAPEKQFTRLADLGFELVRHEIVADIGIAKLSDLLVNYRTESPYMIDGLIVQSNVRVRRTTKKYPTYAFAFKIDGPSAEAEVLEVIWNTGQWKQFKPKVRITPTVLGGFENKSATAHNANFIWKNNIGPGAIVTIIRSGDVIPQIVGVVKAAKNPQMPSRPYVWNASHVDVHGSGDVVEDEALQKRINNFFKKMEINEIGPSRVAKMYKNGLNSILAILQASEEQIVEAVESRAIGIKISANIRKGLHNVDIAYTVGAAGALGEKIGRERVVALVAAIPDILTRGSVMDPIDLQAEIMAVDGLGGKTAEMIVENIGTGAAFAAGIRQVMTHSAVPAKPASTGNSLKGQVFVVTGFTDKDLAARIVDQGGIYSTNWTKGVTGVIAGKKSLEKRSGKIKNADEAGIHVYSIADFQNKFF